MVQKHHELRLQAGRPGGHLFASSALRRAGRRVCFCSAARKQHKPSLYQITTDQKHVSEKLEKNYQIESQTKSAGQPLIRRLALPDIAQGSLTSGRYCKSRSALHRRTLRAADVEVESSRMPGTGRAAADCCRGGRSRSDERGATLTAAT
jgi:hypothetical protein